MSRAEEIRAMHRRQAEHHSSVPMSAEYAAKSAAWLDSRTTDYWRHDRMRSLLLPLLASRNSWLTVGDGRFGADAHWLIEKGQDVVCTDIQTDTLAAAHDRGLISDYQSANAEDLPFEDEAFDWALCKESYHHMPRAPLAFHELLRVTRKGIVLIEPIDTEASNWWGHLTVPLLNLVKRRGHAYEPSGNYVYSLSRFEVEKMMLGIGLRHYAFRDLSDYFIEGTEHELFPGPIYNRIKRNIALRDLTKTLLGVSAQLGIFIVFHDQGFIPNELGRNGYRVVSLPSNPYITETSK